MRLRIHLEPEDLRHLVALPAAASTLSAMREGIFEELGVMLPEMRLVPDPALGAGGLRFGWGDLMTEPRVGPVVGQFSVFWWAGSAAETSASTELREAGTTLDRGADAPCVVLPDRFRAEVEASGFTPYDPLEHLTVEISDVVRAWAWLLQTEAATAWLMQRLSDEAPVLAASAGQLPEGLVHELLVELLRDRIPIRNVDRIVELALRYDALGSPAPDRIAFVRWGLADLIGSLAARESDVVVAYLLSKDHEQDPGPGLVSDLQEALLELPARAAVPALITSNEARPAVADLLREPYPQVRVLGYGDLPVHLHVQPVSRIGG